MYVCVSLQIAVAVEAKKKAAMDAHLELMVGQTEKYSKMLASNLTGGKDTHIRTDSRTCMHGFYTQAWNGRGLQ